MENQNARIPSPDLPASEPTLAGAQLAMAYVPMQSFRNLYSPAEALIRGTLFEELDKPLVKGGN